jgi:hypothetical protein
MCTSGGSGRSLLTEQFGCTSFASILKQRVAIQNDRLDFMHVTKKHDDVDYPKRPTHLHWLMLNFLEAAQLQNDQPVENLLRNSSKRTRRKKKQTQWLDDKNIIYFLEREISNMEQGVAVLACVDGSDSSDDDNGSNDYHAGDPD